MAWICGHQGCNNKEFKDHGSRNRHVKVMHRPRPFKCTLMNKFSKPGTKAFQWQFQLKNHERSAHSDEKNYKCTECEKEFFDKKGLSVHLEWHERGREKEQRMDAEKDVVAVKIDPTRKPSEEVSPLRKLEMDQRAVAPLNMLTEFDPRIRAAVKAFNEAVICKQKTIIQSIPDSGAYFCLNQILAHEYSAPSSRSLSRTTNN